MKVADSHVIFAENLAAVATFLNISVRSAWKDLHNFGRSFDGASSSSASGYEERSKGESAKLHGFDDLGVLFSLWTSNLCSSRWVQRQNGQDQG